MPPPAYFVARWGCAVRAFTATVHSVTRWVTYWAFAGLARWAGLCEERPVGAEEEWIVIEADPLDQRSHYPTRAAFAWQFLGTSEFLLSCFYTSSVFFIVELFSGHLGSAVKRAFRRLRSIHSSIAPEWGEASEMPNVWEKRLVQTSEGFGQEVILLRKSQEAGHWLVGTSTEGLCKVKITDRISVRTEMQGPKVGVTYAVIAILSQQRRDQMMAEANAMYQQGTAGVRTLTYRPGGARMAIRRYMAALMSTPTMGFQVLRWCFRKPVRVGGLLGLLWVVTEFLKRVGVFSAFYGWVCSIHQSLLKIKDSVTEASDMALETWDMLVLWYNAVCSVIDPWKIPVYLIVGYLLCRLYVEVETSESPANTPVASGAATPIPEAPVGPSREAALEAVSVAMMNQGEVLEKVAERLRLLESSSTGDADEASAVRDARFESKAEKMNEALASQTKTWEDMKDRLEHFEKIFEEVRLGASRVESSSVDGVPVRGRSPLLQADLFRPDGVPAEEVSGPVFAASLTGMSPSVSGKEKKSASQLAKESPEMSVLIKKMQKQSQTSQEIYVLALNDFQEVDKESWASIFPPGYRERTAPQFLGELYSLGRNLKSWAKEWLKDKQLGDCPEARDILGACSALDTLFLTDKVPGAINQVTTEKLARKVMGIRLAYKDVMKVGDWKKTEGSKTWKSKVDRETWRRIDPQLEDADHMFVNRRAEDEMRTEMDRDAALLKAKAKLADRTD